MRVMLLEDVERLGTAGQIVEVAEGYARNVLFPKGLAAAATEGRVRAAEATKARAAQAAEKELARLQGLVDALDGKTVPLSVPVGPTGKLHGGITADDIRQEVERALKVSLPPGCVRLPVPLTEPGEHRLTLSFPHGLEAEIIVVLEGKPAAA